MGLEWNYYYYQPWSNNEWLIKELIDNDDITEEDNKISDESYL